MKIIIDGNKIDFIPDTSDNIIFYFSCISVSVNL